MFVKAPRLALKNSINIAQIIEDEVNFVIFLVLNLETVGGPPQLLKSSCQNLHVQEVRGQKLCRYDELS